MTLARMLWERLSFGGERDTAERQFGTRFDDSRHPTNAKACFVPRLLSR